jgi:DsbC/DsbD-like thiol-disulfide interchange protein
MTSLEKHRSTGPRTSTLPIRTAESGVAAAAVLTLGAVLVSALPLLPAHAFSAVGGDTATATDWIDEGDVRVRLIDGGPAGQGKHRLGFELDLAEGWKTYWRHPGETGVSPILSWDRSFNVASVEARYPTPTRFIDSGATSFGYKTDIVLPLEVTLNAPGPALVQLDVMYAICADICLPLQASFELSLSAEPDSRGVFAVQRAMRKVPSSTPPSALAGGVDIARAASGKDAFTVSVPLADAPPEAIDIFAESSGGWHVPPLEPQGVVDGHKLFALDLAGLPQKYRVKGAELMLTIAHPLGAFEQTLALDETFQTAGQ